MQNKIDKIKVTNKIWNDIVKDYIDGIYNFFNFLEDDELFYNMINKCSVDDRDNLCHAIKFYDYFNLVIDKRASPLKALLMVFVLEGATYGGCKYIDFYEWVIKKENKVFDESSNKNSRELELKFKSFYDRYKQEQGSLRGFKNLFIEYLKQNEKIELLQSYQKEINQYPCYNKNKGCCNYRNCYLETDSHSLNKFVEDIADMIYIKRCDFAHAAKLGHFTKSAEYPLLADINNGSTIFITLNFDEFEILVKKIIYRYLIKNK